MEESQKPNSQPDRWADSRPHREKVMRLIRKHAHPADRTLCILGAGQANDLELPALLEWFDRVTLVDLDRDALNQAVAQQQVAGHPNLRLAGSTDVTGIHEMLQPEHLDPQNISRLIGKARSFRPGNLGEPFDMVVSTCLLSQLVMSVVETVKPEHPQFVELVKAIRLQHFEAMNGLLRPGGTGLLITDFVSSDSFPELKTTPPYWLSRALTTAIRRQNCFYGMNPVMLYRTLLEPPLRDQVICHGIVDPWLWNNSFRLYAITGLRFEKRNPEAAAP